MDDDIARLALARNISARTHQCSLDELRVLDVVLTRLELGRDQYGPLDLSQPRDWKLERAEEIVDAEFYRACDLLCARDLKLAAIADGLDEITHAEPIVPRTTAINFGDHVDLLDEDGSQQ